MVTVDTTGVSSSNHHLVIINNNKHNLLSLIFLIFVNLLVNLCSVRFGFLVHLSRVVFCLPSALLNNVFSIGTVVWTCTSCGKGICCQESAGMMSSVNVSYT